MRVLITGAAGFAGRHLTEHCRLHGGTVTGVGRGRAPDRDAPDRWISADLGDAEEAAEIVREARPDLVFHLAARASVGGSLRNAPGTIGANTAMTVNLLEAIANAAPAARVLVAGSGEQYGPADRLPVTEDAPFRPQNPYAVSKCAADLAAGYYADARGLHVLRMRAFNHLGPGLGDRSAAGDFARRIAAAERDGRASVEIRTSPTRTRRDFADVRDVTRAYWDALNAAPPGAYNVCSGRSVGIAELARALGEQAGVEVRCVEDPALLRAGDVPESLGSYEQLNAVTGWEPRIPLSRTLEDTLAWWRAAQANPVAR